MTVTWSDEVDAVLAGDVTAALAYLTPAGGSVVTAVAPVGLRDRSQGSVTFTTSLGFGKKLKRIERDPRVALAYHARDHGFASGDSYVLVQGRCRPVPAADPDWNKRVLGPASARFMGPPRQGFFWDRWLREYYADRVPVTVHAERILVWPALDCSGEPEVHGANRPDGQPDPQRAPKQGSGPRLDAKKAAGKLARMPHILIAWRERDGFPMVVPIRVEAAAADGIRVGSAATFPRGGRRELLPAQRLRVQRRARPRTQPDRAPLQRDRRAVPLELHPRRPGLAPRPARRTRTPAPTRPPNHDRSANETT